MAIANALSGIGREAAERAAEMDRQTMRDWMVRYNAEGTAGLTNQPRCGRRPLLEEGGQAALKAPVLRGPDLERDVVATWQVVDICRLYEERFGVVYSESVMLQVLHGPDLS